ncbi:MAG: hypothetical protein ACYDC9_04955 [Dermatophilaceae bacterium]
MGQADSKLRQSLPQVAFGLRGCLSGSLQDLMGVEGMTIVQESLGFKQAFVR